MKNVIKEKKLISDVKKKYLLVDTKNDVYGIGSTR